MSEDIKLKAFLDLEDLDIEKFAHSLGIPSKITKGNPLWTSESGADITPTIVEPLSREEILIRIAEQFKSHTANFFLSFYLEMASEDKDLDHTDFLKVQDDMVSGVKVVIE